MLAAILLVAVGGIVAQPLGLVVAVLTGLALAAAIVGALGRGDPRSVPVESVLVPAVLAAASVGAIRFVPPGVAWLPALGLVALALWASIRLETRLAGGTASATEDDRFRVLVSVLGTALVAFAAVAALVPPGFGEAAPPVLGQDPGNGQGDRGSDAGLITLVAADGIAAALLGYRTAALRYPRVRDRLWSAATYAVVVAVAAGVARAIDLPRLVGPAVLTLVFYLWDAIHTAAPARRREIRFVWETALLVVLGVVVVAWNLRLRG